MKTKSDSVISPVYQYWSATTPDDSWENRRKNTKIWQNKEKNENMEVQGFEPRTSRMQSERSTTELHPLVSSNWHEIYTSIYEIQLLNILNRELKQRRFWATHVNQKWGLLPFYMPGR